MSARRAASLSPDQSKDDIGPEDAAEHSQHREPGKDAKSFYHSLSGGSAAAINSRPGLTHVPSGAVVFSQFSGNAHGRPLPPEGHHRAL